MRKPLLVVAGLLVVAVLVVVNRSQHRDRVVDEPVGEFTMGNLMDPGQAAETARRFMILWAGQRDDDTAATWEDRLDPLVTHEVGEGLLATDLDAVPRFGLSAVTPPDIRLLSTSETVVVVTAEDGSQFAVTVAPYGPGYAVSDFAGVGGE